MLTIRTPEGTQYEGEVTALTIPHNGGKLTILANHAPLTAIVEKGTCTLKTEEETKTIPTPGGIIEITKTKTTIMTNPE